MGKEIPIISIVVPPFPTFIEGNITHYSKGQVHPNRQHLQYFDMIFVKKGALYLTEEAQAWTIEKNEMIVLLPKKHHFSTKPCDETTVFYWLHFYTDGRWVQDNKPIVLSTDIPIPDIHYHNEAYTIHLNKWQKMNDAESIFELLDRLLEATTETRSISFWDNQQRFTDILRIIEQQTSSKMPHKVLAEKVELYLKHNFQNKITNELLAKEFHFHENYIIRCMKRTFNYTPLEYLADYRLEYSTKLLIKTTLPISKIAYESGYQSVAYYSLCFKKKYGVSPLNYRKKRTGTA